MSEPSLHRRIIAGRAGAWFSPVRGLLRAASVLYEAGIALRNRRYDRPASVRRVAIPVISVGNITVGGTGKTPFVIEIARRLEALDYNPAVVARGYNAAQGEPNDEERLIRRNRPGAAYVADPDRVAGAMKACDEFGASVIVLDDGFQHRRLGRSLDIVLIDATCPFGYGYVLPRGLLREPVTSLRRADVVALTRCDQVPRAELARITDRLRTIAPRARHLQCTHRVSAIERLDGTDADTPGPDLSQRTAVLFAALGNARSFETTARTLGVEVVGERWWPDHHRYTERDLSGLLRPGAFPEHDLLLTTEKDAVKLVDLPAAAEADIYVVKVVIDFVADGGTILDEVLSEALAKRTTT